MPRREKRRFSPFLPDPGAGPTYTGPFAPGIGPRDGPMRNAGLAEPNATPPDRLTRSVAARDDSPMGYDLHITRADHWLHNRGHEISVQEWLELVQQDIELSPDPENGTYSVTWKGREAAHTGWFDWYDGNVFTTDPSRPSVRKLLAMAESLQARVQGDDGEVYECLADWTPRGG